MQLLVTGHLGYVGSVLLPMLLQRGHRVRGIDSGLFEGCAVGPRPRISGLQKDVRDVEPADLEGFDGLIHLAGLSNDPMGELDPQQTYDINYHGAARLAEMAKAVGIKRFVMASSCSVYGAAGDDLVDEQSEPAPVTSYAKSKVLAEADISALTDEQFHAVILRPATVYGPSPMIRFDLAVNNLVAWALTTHKVLLKSDGQAWRPFIHVDDLARAFVDAVEIERADPCTVLNVGFTQENYRIRQIADFVANAVPEARVEFQAGALHDTRNYRVSFERLEALSPDWQPRWTCESGAQQLASEVSRLNLSETDFEGPRFNRVDRLRRMLETGEISTDMRRAETVQRPKAPAVASN
ncbi:MAG: SDR family oxidoreductase [Pseudomonadota bacterium]